MVFIQGFLATVLSTGKDCIPSSAATEVPPGVLYGIFRPVYKLIGTCTLLWAQAETSEQVGRQRETSQSSSPDACVSSTLWGTCREQGWGGRCSK